MPAAILPYRGICKEKSASKLSFAIETDEELARKAANQDKLNMMFYNILEVKGNDINH